MACEPTMKPMSAARTQVTDDSWSSLTVLSERRMLSTLGGDLRNVYEDVTSATQPRDLMRLAAMIDERLGQSNT
jgi:hypothetical protein